MPASVWGGGQKKDLWALGEEAAAGRICAGWRLEPRGEGDIYIYIYIYIFFFFFFENWLVGAVEKRNFFFF
ncbi:hypothetical protein RchiOBHm_Chr7g0183561 [Rosa chinensis]|uniref:Uncharacterized protein n=1 Tax=Rosa chinensis TaxID=74649 RepID=A0A2P6P367_ROSCH|nr:hypothetical protein RchiOBHm_Chr7g0183561 [Rosa chinensis]